MEPDPNKFPLRPSQNEADDAAGYFTMLVKIAPVVVQQGCGMDLGPEDFAMACHQQLCALANLAIDATRQSKE